MGDLAQVAADYRLIAVEAEPTQGKFSVQEVSTLQANGRNLVLGIIDVGFCDRDESYWRTASDGWLPCVANLHAQIGERAGRPRQVWMDLEDKEYQHLLGEYVAPRVARTGVDGFLLEGFDLLDHGPDDDAPCDSDCVAGGLAFLASLREEFPSLTFVIQGGLSRNVRAAHVDRIHEDRIESLPVSSLIDGIVAEGVYTPAYDAKKEAALLAWKALDLKVAGHPFAIITEDYVKSCDDVAWAELVWKASRSHGFTPGVGLSPIYRPRVCHWGFGP
jgi:cysteinyl-tRNA synthetase